MSGFIAPAPYLSIMKKILTRSQAIQLSGLLVADSLVFGMTNPNQVPSIMLIIGFLLLSATAYYVYLGLLSVLKLYGVPIRYKKRLLKAATGLTAGMVALQSIGQLVVRDVLVLSLLTGMLYLYTAYAKNLKQAPTKQQQV